MSVVLSTRVSDELAAGFDAVAVTTGGRSALLQRLVRQAAGEVGSDPKPAGAHRDAARLMVRLAAGEAIHAAREADAMGLPRSTWVAALVAAHARGAPRFARPDEVSLIAIQGELRRIGVNVNQIARALNTAVMEGRVLDTELGAIEDLRLETRAHINALREVFAGNVAYWTVEL